MNTSEEALRQAEELLERLEQTRAEVERLAVAEDAERAIDVLAELAELAKEVEAQLNEALRRANAGA